MGVTRPVGRLVVNAKRQRGQRTPNHECAVSKQHRRIRFARTYCIGRLGDGPWLLHQRHCAGDPQHAIAEVLPTAEAAFDGAALAGVQLHEAASEIILRLI